MIIVCPKCAKRHKVDLNTVRPEIFSGQRIRANCRACGNSFVFSTDKIRQFYTPSARPKAHQKKRTDLSERFALH